MIFERNQERQRAMVREDHKGFSMSQPFARIGLGLPPGRRFEVYTPDGVTRVRDCGCRLTVTPFVDEVALCASHQEYDEQLHRVVAEAGLDCLITRLA